MLSDDFRCKILTRNLRGNDLHAAHENASPADVIAQVNRWVVEAARAQELEEENDDEEEGDGGRLSDEPPVDSEKSARSSAVRQRRRPSLAQS